jgi:uncharacterized protein (TIGR03083 family)
MTDPFPPADAHVAAYRALRDRVCAVIADADRDAPSPLTPAWTVGDTFAHMVGVTTDVLEGRLEGVASDAWTQAQVDARVGRSISSMIDEWQTNADAFDAVVAAVPTVVSGQVLFDAVTHEHDVRHAVGAPSAPDTDAVAIAANWILVSAAAGKSEMTPAVRLLVGDHDVVWGTGESTATATASPFELVRTVSGRRSAAQVLAAGFPSVESAMAAAFFRPAATDVLE